MKRITRVKLIEELERLNAKATPAPWAGTSNIPFYAFLTKPGPSQSKHDTPTSPHWKIADVELVLFLRNNVEAIIETLSAFEIKYEDYRKLADEYKGLQQRAAYPIALYEEEAEVIAKIERLNESKD